MFPANADMDGLIVGICRFGSLALTPVLLPERRARRRWRLLLGGAVVQIAGSALVFRSVVGSLEAGYRKWYRGNVPCVPINAGASVNHACAALIAGRAAV